MLITGSGYAELIMWEDGAIRVYKFYHNANSQKALLEAAYNFWQRVLKAREYYKMLPQYAGDVNATNQIWANIQSLEPDADSTEAYLEYIKERNNGVDVIKGTPSAYRYALGYQRLNALSKEVEEAKQLYKNKIYQLFDKHQCAGFDFEKNGKVIGGKRFASNVKPGPDLQEVKSTIQKLLQMI